MTADRIEITSLRIVASVGVLPEEHDRPQPLELSMSVEVDLSAAGASDALADTVNYAEVVDVALAVAGARHHELLESLADGIGRAALGVDDRIEAVSVSVTKLRPPIGADVATVGVLRRCVR
jgi:dihydroneopterin aldolase